MSAIIPQRVYFIGIGGIGMSGLARYFKTKGSEVQGYDKTPSPITDDLQQEGIDVHFDDNIRSVDPAFLSDPNVLVVRTPAVPVDSELVKHWGINNILKRAEVLGRIAGDHTTFAVAGTHGKTSVSTILAHLLASSGRAVNAFLGGISVNYGSNVILDSSATLCVVEADEFDRSFLHLHPEHAVITSTDADHLDVYGSSSGIVDGYRDFAKQVKSDLILKKGVAERLGIEGLEYGVDAPSDAFCENLRIEKGSYHFDFVISGVRFDDLQLGMAGRHNVENALAATCLAIKAGLDVQEIRHGLGTFKGIKRRFNVLINRHNRVLIDDYAHHPTELIAAISSAREMYPGRSITVVFQPHLYSRTKDFATGFASSLSMADQLVLLDIYPAREKPIPGVTSEWLAEMVDVDPCVTSSKEELVNVIRDMHPDVLLMLGAGDIGQEVSRVASLLTDESVTS